MINDKDTLQQIVRSIANEPVGFGNRLLYDMCKNKPGQTWDDEAVLADKIWLIGRSYAASPERRTKKKSENEEILQGDGTGKFFEEMARHVLENAGKLPAKAFALLKTGRFLFDGGESDAQLLLAGIQAVTGLNGLVKAAATACDNAQNEEENYRNQISFCSKFLHFHFPDQVFIVDSYSQASAKCLFSPRSRTDMVIRYAEEAVAIQNSGKQATGKGTRALLVSDCSAVEAAVAGYTKEGHIQEYAEYAKHCLYAYQTACLTKQLLGDATPASAYPRCADTLLLSIKKK